MTLDELGRQWPDRIRSAQAVTSSDGLRSTARFVRRRPLADAPILICALAVALGVSARLYSPSALWLDETLSVNISALPLSALFEALRHDGSPPLYYLLLHGWIGVFGSSDFAVRSMSSLVSLAALPVGFLLGRRLGSDLVGWCVLVVMATNPYLVRYATETRMYALVVLLVLTGALVTLRAIERPCIRRLCPVAIVAGFLSLTHYWTAFLLVVAIAALFVGGLRINQRAAYWRPGAAIVVGQLLFLPWLPGFLFQLRNTGTPWAAKAHLTDLLLAVRDWSGGSRWFVWPLAIALTALMVKAIMPRRAVVAELEVTAGTQRTARALGVCAIGALVLGLLASGLLHAGYAARYTAPSIALVLVLCGLGLTRLRPDRRAIATALVALVATAITLHNVVNDNRTQARDLAATLAVLASSAELIVYCPDQLGPAVNRALAARSVTIPQVVYPTLAPPQRVDWVDYASRNADADPTAIAQQIAVMAQHIAHRAPPTVWLVMQPGYLTYGSQCQDLAAALTQLVGPAHLIQAADVRYNERQEVIRLSSDQRAHSSTRINR